MVTPYTASKNNNPLKKCRAARIDGPNPASNGTILLLTTLICFGDRVAAGVFIEMTWGHSENARYRLW